MATKVESVQGKSRPSGKPTESKVQGQKSHDNLKKNYLSIWQIVLSKAVHFRVVKHLRHHFGKDKLFKEYYGFINVKLLSISSLLHHKMCTIYQFNMILVSKKSTNLFCVKFYAMSLRLNNMPVLTEKYNFFIISFRFLHKICTINLN